MTAWLQVTLIDGERRFPERENPVSGWLFFSLSFWQLVKNEQIKMGMNGKKEKNENKLMHLHNDSDGEMVMITIGNHTSCRCEHGNQIVAS